MKPSNTYWSFGRGYKDVTVTWLHLYVHPDIKLLIQFQHLALIGSLLSCKNPQSVRFRYPLLSRATFRRLCNFSYPWTWATLFQKPISKQFIWVKPMLFFKPILKHFVMLEKLALFFLFYIFSFVAISEEFEPSYHTA